MSSLDQDAGPSAPAAEEVPVPVFAEADPNGCDPTDAEPNGCDLDDAEPNGCDQAEADCDTPVSPRVSLKKPNQEPLFHVNQSKHEHQINLSNK